MLQLLDIIFITKICKWGEGHGVCSLADDGGCEIHVSSQVLVQVPSLSSCSTLIPLFTGSVGRGSMGVKSAVTPTWQHCALQLSTLLLLLLLLHRFLCVCVRYNKKEPEKPAPSGLKRGCCCCCFLLSPLPYNAPLLLPCPTNTNTIYRPKTKNFPLALLLCWVKVRPAFIHQYLVDRSGRSVRDIGALPQLL